MKKHRILIVDDHREIRSAYRANLELLDAALEIIDVPSGEEALLEASLQHIDLLITDVRLPGFSGLELLEKIKIRNADMKVVLVTGLVDADIRRQVADAKTDAFFLKPVEMSDLLDSVERCLGLVEGDTSSLGDTSVLAKKSSAKNASARLVELRQELDAFSTVLLDDYGKALARAGGLPDAVEKSQVLPILMSTFSSVNKISKFLGRVQPKDLWYFSGTKYDLYWTHVGSSHGLLVAANPSDRADDLARVINAINHAGQDLVDILATMGVTSQLEAEVIEERVEEDIEEELDTDELSEEDKTELANMFPGEEVVTSELNAFWDTATSKEENTGLHSADALSYEQALQLGLTPEDE